MAILCNQHSSQGAQLAISDKNRLPKIDSSAIINDNNNAFFEKNFLMDSKLFLKNKLTMSFHIKKKKIVKTVWAVVSLFVILSMVFGTLALPFLN